MGSKRENVMLAYPVDEKRLSKLPDLVGVQRKLNGERVRVEWSPDGSHPFAKPVLYSSCGNEMPFFSDIKDFLVKQGLHGVNFDGELYKHGMSREEIHSIASRRIKRHPDEGALSLHYFDIIDYTKNQQARIDLMDELPSHTSYLTRVDTYYTTKENIVSFTDHFLSEGYEGSIIRNLSSYYTPRKCNHMLKFKPTEKDIYSIVGYREEVDINGWNKGRLGSVIVIDSDDHVFSVGTGNALNDDTREYWWRPENRCRLKGSLAHVKHSTIKTVNGFPTCTSLLEIEIEEKN